MLLPGKSIGEEKANIKDESRMPYNAARVLELTSQEWQTKQNESRLTSSNSLETG